MQNITQHKTATPTTETKNYPVGTFWKADNGIELYAIIAADKVIKIYTNTDCIAVYNRLFPHDNLAVQIQPDEFSAEYESCQLAIVDAFQTAFPQSVNLEMSER